MKAETNTSSKPEEQQNDIEQTDESNKEEEVKQPWYLSWKSWLKIIIILVILTFIVLAIIYNKTTGKILEGFLNWMQQNAVAGSFAYIAIYWFCTVMFIPGSILTLGAGFVFGQIVGAAAGVFLATLIVISGAGLGASTAFLLGRFVFRDSVAAYKSKYEKFDIIDKVVEEQGLKVTVLLRLSPVIPFSAFNYFMGLTGVKFRDYNIAHIGMIPGTLAYCFIGTTFGAIGDTVEGNNPIVLILTIVGTVLAIIGMVYISYVAKKEFAKIADRQKMKDNEEENNDEENGAATTEQNVYGDAGNTEGDGVANDENNENQAASAPLQEDEAPPAYGNTGEEHYE